MLGERNYALKVAVGKEEDEYLITRHSQFKTPINVINVYGESETRASASEIVSRWHRIAYEIERIENKRESFILVGDLNKQLGREIKDNHKKASHGGKTLIDFLEKGKSVLFNSTNKGKNGPFTRYDPSCPDVDAKKSCLDLIIISRDLLRFVREVVIDKHLQLI